MNFPAENGIGNNRIMVRLFAQYSVKPNSLTESRLNNPAQLQDGGCRGEAGGIMSQAASCRDEVLRSACEGRLGRWASAG